MTWSDAVYGQNCALEFVGKQCRKYQIVVGGPDYFNALSVHANILAGFCHVLSIRVHFRSCRVKALVNFLVAAKENKLPGGGRQVDAASMFSSYKHPTISTLALDWSQEN